MLSGRRRGAGRIRCRTFSRPLAHTAHSTRFGPRWRRSSERTGSRYSFSRCHSEQSGGSAVQPTCGILAPLGMTNEDWWATYFDARYLLEFEPLFDLTRDRSEVARLVEVLQLPVGARILDCPCGQGRHAHLLAEAGFDVDGVDYSRELLQRARERGTGQRLRYTRGDMRQLPAKWTGRFDAVLNLFTSFGFFANPEDDR